MTLRPFGPIVAVTVFATFSIPENIWRRASSPKRIVFDIDFIRIKDKVDLLKNLYISNLSKQPGVNYDEKRKNSVSSSDFVTGAFDTRQTILSAYEISTSGYL
jgi:hypothetical protein